MPKNVGYAWTGAGLIKRSDMKRTVPDPITKSAPMPPGMVSTMKVNRDADKNKRRGK